MTSPIPEDVLGVQRLRAGPLGELIDPFATILTEKGYAVASIAAKVTLVVRFGNWLARHGLGVRDLDDRCVGEFVQGLSKRRRNARRGCAATLRVLLEQVRSAGLAAPAPAETDRSAIGRVLREFDQYLALQRGLFLSTRINYLPLVRWFLHERFGDGAVHLDALQPVDPGRFLARHARTVHPQRARLMVTALRGFLRWLRLRGDVVTDLASAVPSVAYWRLAPLPKSISAEDVERLLRCCARDTEAGQRDYAILLLMARLGLRGGEVVAMDLGDIDWEAGTLKIRGKRGRQDLLPLPADVGKAIASYLRRGRPVCACRKVFVRARAPRRGFAGTVAISTIVRRALDRAGLHPLRKGGHILRHALACSMLRHGATLSEIGQVLRHHHADTTRIYAKVDLDALRALAPAWPRGGR